MGTVLQPHPGWLPGSEPSRGMPALCWSFASMMVSLPRGASSVTFELLGVASAGKCPSKACVAGGLGIETADGQQLSLPRRQ